MNAHRAAVAVVALCWLAGCDRKSPPKTLTAGELSSLKPGPIRGALSAEQVERLKRIQQVFAEVDPTPLPKLVEDFSRDEDPDQEIAIWEAMATAYSGFLDAKKTTVAGRQEAFSLLLLRSGSSTATVLERPLKVLTAEEAADLLSRYTDAPVPIKVKTVP